ncbi:MAG: hypothetical protein V4726_18635 [Verrucomicrobiota bacterium]
MASPFLKTGLILLSCLMAGSSLGILLRRNQDQAGAGLAANSQGPAPAVSVLPENRMLALTRARLEAFRKAGPPSQQIAFALRFAGVSDPGEIRDLLDNHKDFPPDERRQVAVTVLLKRWLELEPAVALEYCRQHHADLLSQFVGSWSQDHPEEAAAFAKALPAGDNQQRVWFAICNILCAKNPAAAWEMLAKTPGLVISAGNMTLSAVIGRMVDQNVEKALDAMATMPPAMLQHARKAIAASLMRTDPARAWDWARQQPDPGATMAAAVVAAMRTDPARALTCLKSLSPEEFAQMSDQIGFRWKTGNMAAVTRLLAGDTVLAPEVRQFAAAHLFEGLSYTDHPDLSALLPLLSPEAQLEKIGGFVTGWFDKDSAAAKAWVRSLPEGTPLREAADKSLAVVLSAPDLNSPERMVAEYQSGGSISEWDPRRLRLTSDHLSRMLENLDQEHFLMPTC